MALGVLAVTIFWGTIFYKLKTTQANQNQSMLQYHTKKIKQSTKKTLRQLWDRHILRKKKQKKQEDSFKYSLLELSYSDQESSDRYITHLSSQSSQSQRRIIQKKIGKEKKIKKLNQRKKCLQLTSRKMLVKQCLQNYEHEEVKNPFLEKSEQKQQPSQDPRQIRRKIMKKRFKDYFFDQYDLDSILDSNQAEQLEIELEVEKQNGMILVAMEQLQKKHQAEGYNPFQK